MGNYTVFDHGRIDRGTARDVLERIRKQAAADNEEIRNMNVDEYTRAMIEDAPYFLEADLLAAMEKEQFESDYARALTYLAQMPTSGIRIMTVQAA